MTDIPFMSINKTEMTINNDAEPIQEEASEAKKNCNTAVTRTLVFLPDINRRLKVVGDYCVMYKT